MSVDFVHLDLRSALDFAIGIEEEAQLRYQEFATLAGDGDVARFFAEMLGSETQHRRQLESRRTRLFGSAVPRFDSSLVGHSEGVDPGEVSTPRSVREAVELALQAETRAVEFYTATLPHLRDADVRALFEDLQAEEAEHQSALRRMLESFPIEKPAG